MRLPMSNTVSVSQAVKPTGSVPRPPLAGRRMGDVRVAPQAGSGSRQVAQLIWDVDSKSSQSGWKPHSETRLQVLFRIAHRVEIKLLHIMGAPSRLIRPCAPEYRSPSSERNLHDTLESRTGEVDSTMFSIQTGRRNSIAIRVASSLRHDTIDEPIGNHSTVGR
jgi:hypothetical protein